MEGMEGESKPLISACLNYKVSLPNITEQQVGGRLLQRHWFTLRREATELGAWRLLNKRGNLPLTGKVTYYSKAN